MHAAAITFAELSWDLTWTTSDRHDRTPTIPSHEVSGVVAGLGPGAGGLAVGDEVYALIEFDRDGAAAEYVTLPAAHLAARPRSVSHVAAATVPLAALTAWQALVGHAAVQAGERVLVQGGAGWAATWCSSPRCSAAASPPPAASGSGTSSSASGRRPWWLPGRLPRPISTSSSTPSAALSSTRPTR